MCRSHGVVAAIHFAAAAIIEEAVVELAKYCRNNVTGMLSRLDGLRAADFQDIVFSSSCVVYGAPKDVIFSRRNLTP